MKKLWNLTPQHSESGDPASGGRGVRPGDARPVRLRRRRPAARAAMAQATFELRVAVTQLAETESLSGDPAGKPPLVHEIRALQKRARARARQITLSHPQPRSGVVPTTRAPLH